ncbi:Vitamin K-dependent protein C (Fragment) [Seminavis robusta]|uniref:Vitamin K-dependent protein C n=1 Tax=Seminavis robusta TaxID=568900 RepID=A0A9N8HHA7_9STRA
MVRRRELVQRLILLLLAASHQSPCASAQTTTRKPKHHSNLRTQNNHQEHPHKEKRAISGSDQYDPNHDRVITNPQGEQQQQDDKRDLLNIDTRVVGGDIVNDLDKHPFFAEWHGQFCGGALIHDDLVITAAHCNNAGTISPSVYFRNIERRQSGSVIRSIIDHVAHPSYNAQYSTRDHDYLLLKLDQSALVDSQGNPTGVQIIDINTNPNVPATNDALWGIGYGQIGEDIAGMSDVLRDAEIVAFANQRCENQYGQYFEESYMFCSGVNGGGIDTCQGDSGGPIVHQATNTLVGIVSFGIGCARANYAGVNSRVSAAQDWINRSKCEYSAYPFCDGDYTSQSTPPPTPAPGGSSGNRQSPGSVTVTVVMDDYPEEISWTMIAQGAQTAMYFLPYEGITVAGATDDQRFNDLTQGVTYLFKVSDSEGDGICCSYGTGSITIYDNVKGAEVWSSRGNFGSYYEVDFDILVNGHVRVTSRSAHYQPSTWEDHEAQIGPSIQQQPSWPGAMPVQNASSIVINVYTDDYPEEISWQVHRKQSNVQSNEPWTLVEEWNGLTAPLRQLVSTEIETLQRGWHRVILSDSEGDGLCCNYGSGYFSLTGPIAANNGRKGLVWGNDGLFWGKDEIYFHVSNAGFISHITYSEVATTAISRTIEQGTGTSSGTAP